MKLIIILGCCVTVFFFVFYHWTAQNETISEVWVDYVLKNATRLDLNPETGRPLRLFQVRILEYDEQRQKSTFTEPRLILYKPEMLWKIEAKRGIARERDHKEIELHDHVVVQKEAQNNAPIVLKTSHLQYFPEEEKIETQSSVTIQQGTQRVEAIGMRAFLKTKQVDLLSRVRGYYEPKT